MSFKRVPITASGILRLVEEYQPDVSLIVSSLYNTLMIHGYFQVDVTAILDTTFGVFVKFTNQEQSVVYLFYVDKDEVPWASTLTPDDEQIDINLSPLQPSIQEGIIDLTTTEDWLNVSTTDVMLHAGRITKELMDESDVYQVGQSGTRSVKLPIVRTRTDTPLFLQQAYKQAQVLGLI